MLQRRPTLWTTWSPLLRPLNCMTPFTRRMDWGQSRSAVSTRLRSTARSSSRTADSKTASAGPLSPLKVDCGDVPSTARPASRISAGSSWPEQRVSVAEPGASSASQPARSASSGPVTRSHLVTSTTSARRSWRVTSSPTNWSRDLALTVSASASTTTASRRQPGQPCPYAATLAGSATPLASMTIWSGAGSNASTRSRASPSSSAIEQQTQPFFRLTVRPVCSAMRAESMSTAPKSLTSTARRRP